MTANFLRLVFKKSARYILYKLRDLARLFTVPCFCVRSSRYSASYRYYYSFLWRAAILIFKCTEAAGVEDYGCRRRGARKKAFFFHVFRFPPNLPRSLSSFGVVDMDVGFEANDLGSKHPSSVYLSCYFSDYTVKWDLSFSLCNFIERNNLASGDVT